VTPTGEQLIDVSVGAIVFLVHIVVFTIAGVYTIEGILMLIKYYRRRRQ
jgi:hypothetical protein